MWSQRVEKLRRYVELEARDLPVDLILAIISHESRGVIGCKSKRLTDTFAVKDQSGKSVKINHAYGLMQCIGSVINGYNKKFGSGDDFVSIEDMRGKGERAARQQIRVGSALLAKQFQQLHSFFPFDFLKTNNEPKKIKLALIAYAKGGNWPSTATRGKGLRPKLNNMYKAGIGLTVQNLKKRYPDWGKKTGENPYRFASSTFKNYEKNKQTGAGPDPNVEDTKKKKSWLKYGLVALGIYVASKQR